MSGLSATDADAETPSGIWASVLNRDEFTNLKEMKNTN